jgi:CRP/FNR family cyclic AMP-dependent transcriptional regulator
MTILRFPFQSIYANLNKPTEAELTNKVDYANYLKQAGIFNQLTNTQLEMIADICHEEVFRTNEVIFTEGAESDKLYFILQGEVNTLVDTNIVRNNLNTPHKQKVVARHRRGQFIGEIALVDQGLRSATARASQNNTHLLVIPRQKLIGICEEFPQLGYRLMKNLAADLAFKLRSADQRIGEGLLDSPRNDLRNY